MAKNPKTKSNKKRDDGAENKISRQSAIATLQRLKGKKVVDLTAKEKEDLLQSVCQILNLVDANGKVK